eukprot:COSAG01_NODE_1875_length_8997_cov_11.927624_6_plen_46_part_00
MSRLFLSRNIETQRTRVGKVIRGWDEALLEMRCGVRCVLLGGRFG